MDKLPVEVLAIIFECLRDWNLLDRPFSYITETSLRYAKHYDGWLVHTVASREDICNFRLMGRKYQNSSLRAFGGILGDKIFRLTRVGLDDLQAISSVAALRPYIDTLTFGNAQFLDPDKMGNLWELLPEPDRSRIHAAYTTEYEWQTSNGHTELQKSFEIILNALPKLESLRLHPFDDARTHNPLSGWLTDGDHKLIRETWGELVERRNLEKCHTHTKDLSVFAPIFSAITSIAKEIRDFQLAPPWSIDASCFYTALKDTNMVPHLRCVRFDLEWRWIPRDFETVRDDLPRAFGHFVDVTHLTINVWIHSLTIYRFGEEKSLLRMLLPIKQLKQLILGGHCHFHKDELVEFVARHNETLEILALKTPIMSEGHGTWTSTSLQILQMPFPALRYFELFEMRRCIARRDYPPAFADAAEWGEFLNAINDVTHEDMRLKLLSELEIGTVQFVNDSLHPPPTKRISSEQLPSLPEHVLLRQEQRRAHLERMRQRHLTQQGL